MQHMRDSWYYSCRLGLTVVLVTGAWSVTWASPPWIPEDTVADIALDILAWLSLLGGVGLRIWSTCSIAGRKGRQLITHGPYAFCRNPLYVGTFCLGIALALFLKSLVFSLAILVLIVFYVLAVVPAEEAFLCGRLGESYRAYRERVPAWFPRWNYDPGINVANSVALRWANLRAEVLQSACWCGLGVLAEVTCHYRLAAVLPQFF